MLIEPWAFFIELQRAFLFQPITEHTIIVCFFGNRLGQTGRQLFKLALERVATRLSQMFQADVVKDRRGRSTAEFAQRNVGFGQTFEGFGL
ncbi:hypothetical protein PYV50_01875 [Pseudomonas sp. H22_DOA]|nr:hypothetical protein PYV50_01875 [Pseudomonas sp. H22_DOA]